MTGQDDLAHDEGGDPAAAFDALCRAVEGGQGDLTREMTAIRRGVEQALDRFEEIGPAADYRLHFARVAQQLNLVVERLDGIEKLPVLRQGAEHYARILERSGTDLVRTAAKQLEASTSDLDRTARALADKVESARERRRQNGVVGGVGAGCLILGVLLTLFMPHALPGTVDVRTASTVMGHAPWQAGMALMQYGNIESWNRVAAADLLVEANRDAVTACQVAAAKSGKEQKCTIVVGIER